MAPERLSAAHGYGLTTWTTKYDAPSAEGNDWTFGPVHVTRTTSRSSRAVLTSDDCHAIAI